MSITESMLTSTQNQDWSRAYKQMPESDQVAVTSPLVGLEDIVRHELSRESLDSVTVCFSGMANEIHELLKQLQVQKITLIDVTHHTGVKERLAGLSKNQKLEINEITGNVFEVLLSLPPNSQDLITSYGSEFLFLPGSVGINILVDWIRDKFKQTTSTQDVARIHCQAFVKGAARSLKPGGLLVVPMAKLLQAELEKSGMFEKITDLFWRKKESKYE